MFYEKKVQAAGKNVSIYANTDAPAPIVYVNTELGAERTLWEACAANSSMPFVLAAISGLCWNHDLSPWNKPAVFKNSTPFTGGADAYLKLLTGEIAAAVSEHLPCRPSYCAIAGYSLAGLFALYSLYQTDFFHGAASVSGSLWFPGFADYAMQHSFCRKPDCVSFSLGNAESRTRNPILKTVEENTRRLEQFYRNRGIHTIYVENQGNHFQNVNERTADGICRLLELHKAAETVSRNPPSFGS